MRRHADPLPDGWRFRFHGIWLSRRCLPPTVDRQNLLFVMDEKAKETSGEELLKHSSLYREFQAEKEEILKHKWIESEKAGHDIGFEKALTDWIIKHRAAWRRSRMAANQAA
jgi:hypothetical protein